MTPFVQELLIAVAKMAVVIGALLGAFSVMTWIERRTLAFMQYRLGPNRTGPFGILQPVADGIKLFFKEEFMPAAADKWAFLAAPVVAVSTALFATAVIPYGPPFSLPGWAWLPEWLQGRELQILIADLEIGLLFIFAVTGLGVYGLVLAGWAANSKYSLLGGLRSSAQMFSYELALGFSWVTLILASSSFRINDIVADQSGWFWNWNVFLHFPAFVVYFAAATAEVARIPFDLPEAESELVAGFMVEYSSTPYLMFMLGEYVAIVLMCALTTILFLGGWLPPAPFLDFIPGVVWFVIKVCFVFFMFAMAKAMVPRYRYDQLMRLGWKVFLPISLLMVALTSGAAVAFDWLP